MVSHGYGIEFCWWGSFTLTADLFWRCNEQCWSQPAHFFENPLGCLLHKVNSTSMKSLSQFKSWVEFPPELTRVEVIVSKITQIRRKCHTLLSGASSTQSPCSSWKRLLPQRAASGCRLFGFSNCAINLLLRQFLPSKSIFGGIPLFFIPDRGKPTNLPFYIWEPPQTKIPFRLRSGRNFALVFFESFHCRDTEFATLVNWIASGFFSASLLLHSSTRLTTHPLSILGTKCPRSANVVTVPQKARSWGVLAAKLLTIAVRTVKRRLGENTKNSAKSYEQKLSQLRKQKMVPWSLTQELQMEVRVL